MTSAARSGNASGAQPAEKYSPENPITVVLATDLHVYAESLARLLRAEADIELCDTGTSQAELLALVERHNPAVALIDLAARDGVAAARAIAAHSSATCVVGFGLGNGEDEIVAAAEAGLAAYVMRDASFDELLAVVRGAVHGLFVCSPRMAAILNARVAALATGREPRRDAHLTRRELEIAELIDQGLSNKQIARRLGLRVSTVKNHVHSVLDKLSVRHRGQVAPLLRGWTRPAKPDAGPDPEAVLTPREFEIAAMFDDALSNDEIAERLNLQVSTVKSHIHSILDKLRVEHRGQAAAAMRRAAHRPALHHVRS